MLKLVNRKITIQILILSIFILYTFSNLFAQSLKEIQSIEQNFVAALADDPNNAALHLDMGLFYAKHGKTNLALNSFVQVLTLAPNDAKGWLWAGHLYRKHNDLRQAQIHIEKSLELDSLNPNTWYELACVRADQANTSDAIRCLHQYLNLIKDISERDIAVARYYLAVLYLSNHQFQQAQTFVSLLKPYPDLVEHLQTLLGLAN